MGHSAWRAGAASAAVGLAGGLALLTPAPGVLARDAMPAASRVEPRFDPAAPGRGPFPSDQLTVPDAAQRTGRRVALPLPSCAVARSSCDDARLVNELDGFDLDPRLALPFSGGVDPASVTPRSVFLVRLGPGPPEATPVDRLVYDADTHTLYARPESLLEPETRYGLVVTRELRDARGRRVEASPAFQRFLRDGGGPPAARAYRRALGGLLTALQRRGIRAADVAVASVFTTGSVTTFLEQARAALDRQPPPPALMAAPVGGGRAYFARAGVTGLALRREVRVEADAEPSHEELPLPLAALPPDAVGGIGVGWYWSPWYLTEERRILDGPTARPHPGAPGAVPVAFVVVLPAGEPPAGGWPVAIVGHGYGGEMFGTALRMAGTLARHGLATVAVTVVGHGGGPGGELVVARRAGGPVRVPAPGRGVDLDGDGVVGPTEGLAPRAPGRLASLSLRDGLRQQVVDLMALVRALRDGLDADGDGVPDTRGERMAYVGQSLGGIYGTLFVAIEPRVEVGVLNVAGGPIAEIARLSPVFRPLVRDALRRRTPPLLEGEGDFRESLPLRGDPAVTDLAAGAVAIQEHLARVEWLGRRGDPVAYARHLRLAPLPGQEPKRVLVQLATGDRVVPNPTTGALVRAGHLGDVTVLLRYDRVVEAVPPELADPHPFLLRAGAPGVAGALARAAQEQVARFFQTDGAGIWNPDESARPPFREAVFEVPAASLPRWLAEPPAP